MATWVTDVQHLVPESDKLAPAPAQRRAAFTREVTEAATKLVFWGIDDEERSFLIAETVGVFELRAIVCRARPHADVPGLLLIDATVEELDEMYTLVEELTDMRTGRRQRDLLDGLRASLCNSMDGF